MRWWQGSSFNVVWGESATWILHPANHHPRLHLQLITQTRCALPPSIRKDWTKYMQRWFSNMGKQAAQDSDPCERRTSEVSSVTAHFQAAAQGEGIPEPRKGPPECRRWRSTGICRKRVLEAAEVSSESPAEWQLIWFHQILGQEEPLEKE